MNSTTLSNGLLRTIIIILGATLLLFLLFKLSSILIYLIAAILISLLASPLVNFFKKKLKFKSIIAISISLILIISTIISVFLLIVPLITKQSNKLALLNVNNLEANYYVYYQKVEMFLKSYNIDLVDKLNFEKIAKSINFNFIADLLNGFFNTIGSFGIGLFITFFIAFFILKDQTLINKNLLFVLPNENRWRIYASLLRIKKMLSKYTLGLMIQIFVVFVLYLAVLLIFGIENAFIIAFLSALLNIIPYIGPLIALLLTTFLTIISHINDNFSLVTLPLLIKVIIGYFIVQLIDGNVSQPIIMSKTTNSHPLEVFLIILIAGSLFGIFGMLFAMPIYTSLKVILHEFYGENKVVKVLTKNFK